MSFDPWTAAIEAGTAVIKRIWPDPEAQAQEIRKLEELRQKGSLAELNAHVQLLSGQMEINKEAAKSGRIWVSGARPFIIWIGGVSMAWSGLIHPLLMWVWAFAGIQGEPPPMIDSSWIMGILTSLLGVAGLRSFDKKAGVQTDHL